MGHRRKLHQKKDFTLQSPVRRVKTLTAKRFRLSRSVLILDEGNPEYRRPFGGIGRVQAMRTIGLPEVRQFLNDLVHTAPLVSCIHGFGRRIVEVPTPLGTKD